MVNEFDLFPLVVIVVTVNLNHTAAELSWHEPTAVNICLCNVFDLLSNISALQVALVICVL